MKKLILHILVFLASAVPVFAELTWTSAAPMLTPRVGHCAAVSGGKIYVFGGAVMRRENETFSTSIEAYDPTEDSWTEVGQLPRGISQAAALTIGNYIYIFGGLTAEGPSREVNRFDPQTNRIDQRGRLPEPRIAMAVVANHGRILMIGGITNRQEFTSGGYWFEPDSNRWIEAPEMNQPRASFGLVSDSLIWAIGGVYLGPSNRVEVFRNNAWAEVPRGNLPEPRGEMGTAFLNDTTLVTAGGITRGGTTNSVIAYSVRSGMWRRLPPLNSERASFPLIALDNKLYAIGGGRHGGDRMGGMMADVQVLAEVNATPFEPVIPSTPKLMQIPIWPNPGNGRFSFDLPAHGSGIEIWDQTGRLIYTNPITQYGLWIWDAGDLPASAYQIRITDRLGKPVGEGRAVLAR